MEKGKQISPKVLRRRRFLMVLPLIAVPFLTMTFWALGGGKGKVNTGPVLAKTEGFNMDLPTAKVSSDSSWDKMQFYEQADKEQAKRETQIRNDPYYDLPLTQTDAVDTFGALRPVNTRGKRLFHEPAPKSPYASTEYKDANETKVYQKLAELNKELSTKTMMPVQRSTEGLAEAMESGSVRRVSSEESPEMRQLRAMMENMEHTNQGGSEPDTEMQEINKALDKLIDVQHPERLNAKIKEESEKSKGQVFVVSGGRSELPISLLEQTNGNATGKDNSQVKTATFNGFYSLNDDELEASTGNAIPAVINDHQTVVTGSTIQLRLASDIFIQGVRIPKNHGIEGTATLNGERLAIHINCIQYKNGLYPVNLEVYDLGGMPGIYVKGAISRDVAKQSADQSLQGLGLSSLDPSIGMQAASAGIEVTKNFLSKRVKLVRVMVKAGHQVLLKDNNVK